MKLTKLFIFIILATALGFSACDDTVTTLGSSLVNDDSEIVIDSAFSVTGISKPNDDIQSRSIVQMLGSIDAKEYGHFSSDFVTQFISAVNLDTTGVSINDLDSIKLLMFFMPGGFTGDSLVPMGLEVYPLTRPLPSPIYSDFDPTGYYDPNTCWTNGTQIYTANALYSDSVSALDYRTVSVKLPLAFAKKFYNEYLTNPATFATPQSFVNFFPGLYIKNSFGSGRVINFNETRINLYYGRHTTKTNTAGLTVDTIIHTSSTYMAVAPEVITNNIINMSLSPQLQSMISAGNTMLVAPASYDIELTFPIREIIASYRANAGKMSVINSLSLTLPVEEITNNYNINPPTSVLLVLTKDKKSFFANNKIADDKTSFLGIYDETNQCYTFDGMRQYLIDMMAKDRLTADDYTFTLTPVDVTYENSSSGSYYYTNTVSYVTAVTPYISGPAMCKINLDDAKIKFTYSKQSINN